MTIAQELARHIAAFDYDGLPPEAVHWARVGILDTVGVTLAGSGEPAARLAADVVATAAGPSLIFGTARRTSMLDAALVNGAASHALDFDDCNNTIGGHPSVPILPALFALADARGASGQAFIAAYVVGFETETRIARGVHFHHYEKGWHPTATLGVFGAAAACSRLLGLDAERTAIALSPNSSLAPGASPQTNLGLRDFIRQLVQLRDALTQNDGTAVSTTQSDLVASEDLLVSALADQGGIQTRIEASQTQQNTRADNLEALLSGEADADLPSAIVKLNQAQTAYQAALQSAANIMKISLLDYIR